MPAATAMAVRPSFGRVRTLEHDRRELIGVRRVLERASRAGSDRTLDNSPAGVIRCRWLSQTYEHAATGPGSRSTLPPWPVGRRRPDGHRHAQGSRPATAPVPELFVLPA